jgi:hypothetical protein
MSARKIMEAFSAGKPLGCYGCGKRATGLWQTITGPEPVCPDCSNARSQARREALKP